MVDVDLLQRAMLRPHCGGGRGGWEGGRRRRVCRLMGHGGLPSPVGDLCVDVFYVEADEIFMNGVLNSL